jgi:hypothetical protein
MAKKRAEDRASGSGSETRPVRIELTEPMHNLLDRLRARHGSPSRGAYFCRLMLEEARSLGLLKDEEE